MREDARTRSTTHDTTHNTTHDTTQRLELWDKCVALETKVR
jgi:hypothetical protein